MAFAHCAGMAPRLGRLLLLPLELPLELEEDEGERAMSSRNECLPVNLIGRDVSTLRDFCRGAAGG
jgi:hypothetical protein